MKVKNYFHVWKYWSVLVEFSSHRIWAMWPTSLSNSSVANILQFRQSSYNLVVPDTLQCITWDTLLCWCTKPWYHLLSIKSIYGAYLSLQKKRNACEPYPVCFIAQPGSSTLPSLSRFSSTPCMLIKGDYIRAVVLLRPQKPRPRVIAGVHMAR